VFTSASLMTINIDKKLQQNCQICSNRWKTL